MKQRLKEKLKDIALAFIVFALITMPVWLIVLLGGIKTRNW